MRWANAIALIVCGLSPSFANAQTTAWLCITDSSVGFSKDSGSWSSARFTPGDKYIIKSSQRQGVAWEVRKFGSQTPLADGICKQTFTAAKILNCTGFFTEFHFNAGTGRFLRIYFAGYWTYIPGDNLTGNDNGDTPVIEIGTCSAV